MARGRMIDNCISISEKINDLTLREAFIYTWIIPHLDDWGRITGSPRKLKALVFPMKKEISINLIEKTLTKFKKIGLFLWENIDNILVLQQPFEEFNEHQSISESKRAKSKYPEILETSQEMPEFPKNCQENPAQDKRREENIREDKRSKVYDEILTFWNSKKIIVHKQSDSIISAIRKTLKKYVKKKINEAIENYSTVLSDEKYFFKYRWSLETFLSRKKAIPGFLSDGEYWINYCKWKEDRGEIVNAIKREKKWEATKEKREEKPEEEITEMSTDAKKEYYKTMIKLGSPKSNEYRKKLKELKNE